MASKRVEIAQAMARQEANPWETNFWLNILSYLEQAGYVVVKTSETAEAQRGLRIAEDD